RRGVAEHFGKRHLRADDLGARAGFHALDAAAPRVQVAHDVAHVFFRHGDFHFHDRLEQHRVAFLPGGLQRQRTGDLERHFAGVDVVVGTVEQNGLDVHQRIAGQHAVFHRFLDAGLLGGDVFLRLHAADDLVLELEAAARFQRLDLDPDVTVLAAAARLPDEFAFNLRRRAERFAIGDLRFADVRFHLEFAV